jgi:hypothetical protein
MPAAPARTGDFGRPPYRVSGFVQLQLSDVAILRLTKERACSHCEGTRRAGRRWIRGIGAAECCGGEAGRPSELPTPVCDSTYSGRRRPVRIDISVLTERSWDFWKNWRVQS